MTDVSAKYCDKVSPEHALAMQAIGMARMMLAPQREHLQELLDAEDRMHSFGHITDPTLYRDMIYSKNFERQTRLIRAARRGRGGCRRGV